MKNKASGARRRMLQAIGIGLIIGALMVAVGGCRPTPALPTPRATDTPTPVPSPVPANSSISGRVWQDECVTGADVGSPATLPAGCIETTQGEYRSNGKPDASEAGIGGVTIQLGAGTCPATGMASVAAQMDGTYRFSGLEAGTYCVSVDASATTNQGLLSGRWSSPGTDSRAADYAVTIVGGETRGDVDFGWEHVTLPTVAPTPLAPTPPS